MPEVSPFSDCVLCLNGELHEKGGQVRCSTHWERWLPGCAPSSSCRWWRWEVGCPKVCTCGKVAESQVRMSNKDTAQAWAFPSPGFCFFPMQMIALHCGKWEGAGQPYCLISGDKQAHWTEASKCDTAGAVQTGGPGKGGQLWIVSWLFWLNGFICFKVFSKDHLNLPNS